MQLKELAAQYRATGCALGETLYTAGYLAHYYDPDSRAPCADCVPARGVLYWRHETHR